MRKKLVIVFVILCMITLIGGFSYAYFGYSETQKTFEKIGSKCFEISMENEGEGITINKAHPMTDEEGLKQEGYTFTIKNICNSIAYYQVNIEDLEIEEKKLPNQNIKASLNENHGKVISEYEKVKPTIEGAEESHKLTSGSLEPKESETYTLKLWMDYETPLEEEIEGETINTSSASYESKISIIASYLEEKKANEITITYEEPDIYNKDSETVTIKAESTNYNIISYSEDGKTYEPVSKEGKEVEIEKTYEEEGTHSIYFKDEIGNVETEEIITNKLDQTGPSITYEEINSEEGEKGWYKKLIIHIKAEDKTEVESISYCTTTNNQCEPEEISSIGLEENNEITLPSNALEQTICTKAIDELGNENTTCSNKYKVDGIIPEITSIENPHENTWTKENVILDIHVEEKESGHITCEESESTEYTKIEGTYQEGIFTTEPYKGTQEKTYSIRCKDEAGNISETQETTIKIDQTEPTIESVNVTNEKRSIIVEVTAEDKDTRIKEKGYNYTLIRDGKEILTVISEINTYTFTNLEMGSQYTVKVSVLDGVGNKGEKESQEIKVPVVILGKEMTLAENVEGLYKVKHEEIEGTVNDAGFQQAEYRYAGSNPDNYIWYNCDEGYTHDKDHCEKWRIIGLVNVMIDESHVEQRVKIIRDESIGQMAWDYNNSTNSTSINWTTSSLQKLLNNEYYNQLVATSYYCQIFDAEGKCTTSGNDVYDFKKNGLKEYAKRLLEEVLWNIATPPNSYLNYNDVYTASGFYKQERTTNTINGAPYTWLSNIGIVYPSDYGYATSGNEIHSRSTCLSTELSSWHNSQDFSGCYNDNWIYHPDSLYDTWTIVSENDINSLNSIIRIMNTTDTMNGSLRYNYGGYKRDVLPVIYLNEDVKIIGGTGNENDPYQITLNGEQVSIDILGKEVPLVKENDGMYKVTHEDIIDSEINEGFKKEEYRYAGKSPNNYIRFNGEDWRIIGLVNVETSEGKVEQRVKIIKDTDIGSLSWDLKEDSTFTNKWSESTLNTLLNGSYYNGKNTTYFTCSQMSYCTQTEHKEMNFSKTGIKSTFQNMIEKVYWDTSIGNSTPGGQMNALYVSERKGEKIENNIGLIYPSDYYYTTGSTSRNSCLNYLIWRNNENCYGDAWLYPDIEDSIWTISGNEAYPTSVHRVISTDTPDYNGTVANNDSKYQNLVLPTLYLKNTVKITKGNGTKDSPFEISLS